MYSCQDVNSVFFSYLVTLWMLHCIVYGSCHLLVVLQCMLSIAVQHIVSSQVTYGVLFNTVFIVVGCKVL